mmetsp:Transcript_34706/g.63405  ORF Transcript_34706/g.63405 Transcript_34706/m.63405 type:complete len:251 (-) Transcript_34706:77-829(-)
MTSLLTLKVLHPKAGEATTLEVPAATTGQEFRLKVAEAFQVDANAYALLAQNGSRNAAKISIDLQSSLEASGVQDQATVTMRPTDLEVEKQKSVLRTSISKNGTSSYYYAHANEKELPQELRYVYGGEPTKLSVEEAPEERVAPVTLSIGQYSWADEGDFVCIYISVDGEQAVVAAAKDGKNDEVKVDFSNKSFILEVQDGNKRYVLALRELESEISPDESKFRVSAGKRITIKMKKKSDKKWTRLTKPA